MKIKKLNQHGMAHWLVPALVVVLIAAVGTHVLLGSHADSLTWRNYFSVNTKNINVTLTRDNPNYPTSGGYTQGLLYGAGFTMTNKTATGYEMYNETGSQGVGFYEGSGGISDGQVIPFYTYINPNKPNGVYTGSYILKYSTGNSVWLNGPTINYTITLVDSISTNYITVTHKDITETLSKAKATAGTGLVFGKGPVLTGVQSGQFDVYPNQPTQGQGFYTSSGGIGAGDTVDVQTYMNTNKPDGVYTGSATLQYYVSALQKWENGPTLTYTITLTN